MVFFTIAGVLSYLLIAVFVSLIVGVYIDREFDYDAGRVSATSFFLFIILGFIILGFLNPEAC